ncbi:hypothetical protein FKM82_020600 [Ascaphus truei]
MRKALQCRRTQGIYCACAKWQLPALVASVGLWLPDRPPRSIGTASGPSPHSPMCVHATADSRVPPQHSRHAPPQRGKGGGRGRPGHTYKLSMSRDPAFLAELALIGFLGMFPRVGWLFSFGIETQNTIRIDEPIRFGVPGSKSAGGFFNVASVRIAEQPASILSQKSLPAKA